MRYGMVTTLVCSIIIAPLAAAPLEREAAHLAEKLSSQYRKDNEVSVRRNLAVLELEFGDSGEKKTAETLRELLNSAFSRSNVFALIDRRGLDAVLHEMELNQSGLTASKPSDMRLANADALVSGKVTRNSDGYQLAARLTDVATGRQYAATLQVADAESEAATNRRLDREFSFTDGIGLSLFMQTTLAGNSTTAKPIPGDNDTVMSALPGIELRYRFGPYIMAGAGFARVYGQARYFESVTSTASANGAQAQTAPMRVVAQGFSVPLHLYLTYPVSRRWQVFLAPGADFQSLTLHGYFLPSRGNGFGANEVGPFLTHEFFALKLFAGLEFFITPRMALSLRAGYVSGAIEVSTTPLRHLNLPDPLALNLGGFTYSPALTVYF